jgi:hypothetical protein
MSAKREQPFDYWLRPFLYKEGLHDLWHVEVRARYAGETPAVPEDALSHSTDQLTLSEAL